MDCIKLNGHRYYQYDTIIETYPRLKYKARASDFIKHNHVPDKSILYARFNNDTWKIYKTAGRWNKLFINKRWFDDNINCGPEYPYIPPTIFLSDDELFTDDDGKHVDIHVVGTRSYDNCYFSIDDICSNFNLKNSKRIIASEGSSYIYDTHYKYFTYDDDYEHAGKRAMFVTYEGLLKLAFTSRTGNTKPFITWVAKTVFTTHLGTIPDKQALAANLVGASPESINNVFNTFTYSMPCVYLFSIGLVGSLRKSMDIPDDYNDSDIVVKWGYSSDLFRRSKEHSSKRSYGGIKGSNISLLYNSMIDPQYITKAESDIRGYFADNDYSFKYKKDTELAIVPKKHLRTIKKQYALIGSSYAGHIKDLQTQMETLKSAHTVEIANIKLELASKDNELLCKDNELLRLQLKYAKCQK